MDFKFFTVSYVAAADYVMLLFVPKPNKITPVVLQDWISGQLGTRDFNRYGKLFDIHEYYCTKTYACKQYTEAVFNATCL